MKSIIKPQLINNKLLRYNLHITNNTNVLKSIMGWSKKYDNQFSWISIYPDKNISLSVKIDSSHLDFDVKKNEIILLKFPLDDIMIHTYDANLKIKLYEY